MSYRAIINKALNDDKILIPFVWVGYLATSAFAFPPVEIEWKEIFYSFYHIGQAYIIAYLFSDFFLRNNRYASFFGVSSALVLFCAVFSEYIIELHVFGSRSVWWGVYWEAAQIAVVTLFLLVGRLIWNRRETERKLEQLALAAAETELKYLKAQINPHILFNALNNIYAFALKNSKRTPDLILKFSEILRYAIYECSDETVLLEKEVSYLRDFIDIQKLASGEKGRVEFTVIGDAENRRIPPFLLIPFVENCFKHGTNTIDQVLKINIKLTVQQDTLLLECENNYQETKPALEGKDAASGLGLDNVKRRLGLLFGDAYELAVNKADDVFSVILRIPIQ